MVVTGVVPTSIHSVKWQDYRGSETGMIVYYNTDPVSEIPLRELPEELPSEIVLEPNYETGTYGFYGCKHTKTRSSFNKKKIRYLLFMTRYAGTNVEFMDDLMITGFYRIKQVADVQKLHIRYLHEYSCINEDSCLALRADKVHFVAVTDAFMVTPEVLESWECKSRVTRQTKILLDKEKTAELLTYLESKKNIIDLYSSETERLQPAIDEDEEEEDDEELFEDAGDYEENIDDLEEEKEEDQEAPEVTANAEADKGSESTLYSAGTEILERTKDNEAVEIEAGNEENNKDTEDKLLEAETEIFEKKEVNKTFEVDTGNEEPEDTGDEKQDTLDVDISKPEEDKSSSF